MDTDQEKFYITTPIYYVTAKPHLGSLYSTLLADVLMRWNKLFARKTFFLTGTDEHGQKIAQAAEKQGMEPKKFVDSFIPAYKNVWHQYRLDYTYFIRTTDTEHGKAVQIWLQQLIDKGDVYKAFYEGWYCTQDEAFVTEVEEDNKSPLCPLCARETIFLSEESYFFKLSAYQEKLLDFYEKNPDFIVPKERFQEVINFVKSGLRDLSISRTTISWGIPFPGNQKHVTYVWADALNNYITALGYGQPEKEKEFNYWWPADIHVLGKDIVRFHAIYWPAFLMASGLALPKHLLVHGWIKINNEKMSKSRHNVIDPKELADVYGVDPIRYYLMRHLSISQDSNFAIDDLEQRINADLANDLGNLLNRMSTLAEKNQVFTVECPEAWSEESMVLYQQSLLMLAEVQEQMKTYSIHMALGAIWKFIAQINGFFHAHEPWKVVKTDRQKFIEIISATCHGLRTVGILLWPIMPTTMEQLLLSLSSVVDFGAVDCMTQLHDSWNSKFIIQKIPNLFNKIEIKEIKEEAKEIMQQPENIIEITDFLKIELRVGTIEECHSIEKSDKLYRLVVNFGEFGLRQILSGIKQSFKPEDLIGRQAVFVFNLKERAMMGLKSQGMILTARDAQSRIQLVSVQEAVPNGTSLQ